MTKDPKKPGYAWKPDDSISTISRKMKTINKMLADMAGTNRLGTKFSSKQHRQALKENQPPAGARNSRSDLERMLRELALQKKALKNPARGLDPTGKGSITEGAASVYEKPADVTSEFKGAGMTESTFGNKDKARQPKTSTVDPDSARHTAAIKAKAKKAEQKRKAEREGFEELEESARVGRLRSEKGRDKFKSPKDFQVVYHDFGSKDAPGTPPAKVNISSADSALNKKVANQAVNKVFEDTPGRFGTAAGKKAIKGFFKENFGIEDIDVSYDFPTEEEARGGMKRGGKVKKTKSKPTKKYAMNRGGKVTSVRKPTRA
jgi:hypothetical protein